MSVQPAPTPCPSCGAHNAEGTVVCLNCSVLLISLPQIHAGFVLASRYEVVRALGAGGMGIVYEARDRLLNETAAIKVLRPEVAGTPDMAQRFVSEIKLARAVSHKNVCRIHEYGEDRGLRYISMAFVNGVDLRRVLRERGPLAPELVYEVSIQAADGLQAIHDEGIVHRDLKSSNITVDARGVVRVMDFGLAKQSGVGADLSSSSAGQMVGTPDYMSPEQVRGMKLDARSDVYSLGIVVYELFTGRTPFRSETPVNTILKHLNEPPALEGVEALPPSAVPVLRKALQKDPGQRYATAREMGRALDVARSIGSGATQVSFAALFERRPADAVANPSYASSSTWSIEGFSEAARTTAVSRVPLDAAEPDHPFFVDDAASSGVRAGMASNAIAETPASPPSQAPLPRQVENEPWPEELGAALVEAHEDAELELEPEDELEELPGQQAIEPPAMPLGERRRADLQARDAAGPTANIDHGPAPAADAPDMVPTGVPPTVAAASLESPAVGSAPVERAKASAAIPARPRRSASARRPSATAARSAASGPPVAAAQVLVNLAWKRVLPALRADRRIVIVAAALVVLAVGAFVTARFFSAPQLVSVEPSRVGLGQTLALVGNGFSPEVDENRVLFAGDQPGRVLEASRNRLSVQVPNLNVSPWLDSPVAVVVRVAGRSSAPFEVTVYPVPRIQSLSPDAGSPGDVVVIIGSGWVLASTVRFGNVEAEVLDSGFRSIRVRVPAVRGPSVPVVVINGTVSSEPVRFRVRRAQP